MRLTSFLLVLFATVPALAQSEARAEVASGVVAPDGDELAEMEAAGRRGAGVGTGSGAGLRARRPWVPPVDPIPPVTNSELRQALLRAQPEMQACIDAAGLRSGTVRARLSRDGALSFTIRSRPRDPAAEVCVETVARRHVTPLLSRPIRRAVSASVRLGRPGATPPPPVPPMPAPGGGDREVHDQLDRSAGSLRRCLDEAFPGMTGSVGLRVVAHRDGSMVLEGASLPPGFPAGPMLVCLQNEVAHLRVSPGSERSVSHDLILGR